MALAMALLDLGLPAGLPERPGWNFVGGPWPLVHDVLVTPMASLPSLLLGPQCGWHFDDLSYATRRSAGSRREASFFVAGDTARQRSAGSPVHLWKAVLRLAGSFGKHDPVRVRALALFDTPQQLDVFVKSCWFSITPSTLNGRP